ncbi:MAG TPA: bifunctional oligoribonuclease/PAP phosphatase NrnA [Chitinophagales bacterium]
MQEKLSALKNLIETTKKSVIITHPNPDGDAFGSVLAWSAFLRKFGHETTVISPTNYTQNFKWLKGYETILAFEKEADQKIAVEKIVHCDAIYCLDFNAIARLELLKEAIEKSSQPKVIIDHHHQPESFAQILFSNTKYAATCEFIYDIIIGLGNEDFMDTEIAESLYTGLVTDTGFFGFSNTTPNVHKVAGGLISKGVSVEFINDKIQNIFTENRLHYFGYVLLNKIKITQGGKVAYITVSKEEARKFNLQSGDNEGLVNYPFKIEGVRMAVLFSEEPGKVKISFRSKDDIDVNTFARNHFAGGGHTNAAGGRSHLSLDETEKKFLENLNELF